MKKALTVALGLILMLSLASFGYSEGVAFGSDYNLENSSLTTFAGVEVGSDSHNFELNVGTSDLLTFRTRYLWFDSEYFLGYVQSESLVAGISVGLDTVFAPYNDWKKTVDLASMNFFLRGEVFDLLPEVWPIFGFYAQLDIDSSTNSLDFGGLIGGTLKLPW